MTWPVSRMAGWDFLPDLKGDAYRGTDRKNILWYVSLVQPDRAVGFLTNDLTT